MRNGAWLILIAWLMCCSLYAFNADAKIISAGSCSQADLTTAYNAASTGDTIVVPAGNCTWSSSLKIEKAISIMGAGTSSTILTAGSNLGGGFFQISMTTTSVVRISGFKFDLSADRNGQNYGIYAYYSTIGSLRIDHCRFDYGRDGIRIDGRVFGVIDNNYFYNDDISVQLLGGTASQADQSWADPIVAGMDMGLNTMYVEDNTFVRDHNMTAQTNNHIESGHGGRFVIRYNTFNGDDYRTDAVYPYYVIMLHGNGAYYGDGSNGLRGHPIVEIYNNTISGYRVDGAISFRGGSNIVHDNTITELRGVLSTNAGILVTEEEGWSSAAFGTLRSAWPAQDQITNSFFWNNTVNGNTMTDITLYNPRTDSTFIQKDRDYFMHAPQSSGGKSTYTGRVGGSTTAPTQSDTGNLSFLSSGANAYYPYTPYTYPHPLRNESGTPSPTPSPPQRLRIE